MFGKNLTVYGTQTTDNAFLDDDDDNNKGTWFICFCYSWPSILLRLLQRFEFDLVSVAMTSNVPYPVKNSRAQ